MANLIGITIDCSEPQRLATFWALALEGYSTDEGGVVVKPHDSGPVIYFQAVPEGKAAKNRVHLDIAAADRASEVFRLTRNGATVVREVDEGGSQWSVLLDPEGNEFCVSQRP
jgi:predicted enzyme related to lactoylglutathione lyase